MRRRGEPDDTRDLQTPNRLSDMWNTWMQQWLDNELADSQRQRRRSAHTSVFSVWVHPYMGGTQLTVAMLQTGITWAPPPELLNSDYNGALEHVAKHFASWIRRLARAVTRHKEDPAAEEASLRSGSAPGRHGLTPQQVSDRAARATARANYYLTVDLYNQLKASKGQGKGRVTCQGKGTVKPKSWAQMSRDERWWLQEFWEGDCAGSWTKLKGSATVPGLDSFHRRATIVVRPSSVGEGRCFRPRPVCCSMASDERSSMQSKLVDRRAALSHRSPKKQYVAPQQLVLQSTRCSKPRKSPPTTTPEHSARQSVLQITLMCVGLSCQAEHQSLVVAVAVWEHQQQQHHQQQPGQRPLLLITTNTSAAAAAPAAAG